MDAVRSGNFGKNFRPDIIFGKPYKPTLFFKTILFFMNPQSHLILYISTGNQQGCKITLSPVISCTALT